MDDSVPMSEETFIALADAYLLGEITDEQLAELEEQIATSPIARQRILAVVGQASMIRETFNARAQLGRPLGPLDEKEFRAFLASLDAPKDIALVDLPAEYARHSSPDAGLDNRAWRIKAAAWSGLAALFVVLVAFVAARFLLPSTAMSQAPLAKTPGPEISPSAEAKPTAVAVLNSSIDARWDETGGTIRSDGELYANDRMTLRQGLVEIILDQGVVAVVQGPATFEVTGINAMRLVSGKLTAMVPEAAHGFIVQTPQARVTDYGTEFGVAVDSGGATTVQTYEGLVGLGLPDGSDELALRQNEAATLAEGDAPQHVHFDSLSLMRHNEYRRHLHRPEITGDLRYTKSRPVSLLSNRLESNRWAYIIPEQAGVQIGPGLRCDFNQPGRYEYLPSVKPTIKHSGPVDSYLIHFDPDGMPSSSFIVEGAISFNRPIVGVMAASELLNATDAVAGLDDVAYAGAGHIGRGLEGADRDDRDAIEISPDRRTLTVRMETLDRFDQIRVFVEPLD